MSNFALNINSDAVVKHTNRLEAMHRSALPTAVRSALTSVAFDVRNKSMPAVTDKVFTKRRKNFFRGTSRVEMAKGWDVDKMQSTIGFVGGTDNQAVRNLEQQEKGGKIGGRSFVPLKFARTSNSDTKNVRTKHRLKRISNVQKIDRKQAFHKTVYRLGKGGFIVYKGTMFEIKGLKRGKIKLQPLYDYEKGRSVRIKETNFMERSSLISNRKMNPFFIKAAEKQIKRLKDKGL